ncbi:hypothetical protein XELAEV_18009181mg [Xenopus laevis]|uniref:Uncharacterized protein n=1 Tax=Xenopus laevis TaxID=8355 RepID=A0A974I068_XENLA|nr:hypothetical protein XELAEV_18009181mg [Xenopus laevis]
MGKTCGYEVQGSHIARLCNSPFYLLQLFIFLLSFTAYFQLLKREPLSMSAKKIIALFYSYFLFLFIIYPYIQSLSY